MVHDPDDQQSRPAVAGALEQQLRRTEEELLLSKARQEELIKQLEIAEKKLSFLGLVVASSAESIVTIDFDGIITTWNKAAESIYGYTAAEAVGRPITMLTIPEDLKQVVSNIDRIKDGETLNIFDTVRIQKGGAEIDLEILMSPVTDADGTVIGIATIARDITERIKAAAEREVYRIAELERKSTELAAVRESQTQLAESQMRLAIELAATQQLQEVSTQLIGEEDPNALYESILDASIKIMRAQFASIQSFTPADAHRGELLLLGHRGFSGEAANQWKRMQLDGGSVWGQTLLGGERLIVSNVEADQENIGQTQKAIYQRMGIKAFQSTPLVTRSGRLLGMISTHWRRPHNPSERDLRLLDVLARQAAERIERSQSEEAILRSEEKFRTLFDSIDEGFCTIEVIFDESGKPIDYVFIEVNPAFEEQTGLVNVVGTRMRELRPDHESYWFDIYGEIAVNGKPKRFEALAEAIDGRSFDCYALKVGGPQERKVAVLFTDVTARNRAESRLAFLADFSQALVDLETEQEIVRTFGERVGRVMNASVCAFFAISDGSDEAEVTSEWHRSGDFSLKGRFDIGLLVSPEFQRLMAAGETVAVDDIETNPYVAGKRELAARGIRSFVNVPLIRDGRWKFVLGIYHDELTIWRDDDVTLLNESANRIWTKLERLRMESAARESEARVRQQWLTFNTAVSSITDFVYTFDRDGRFIYVNKPLLDLWGQTLEEAAGKNFFDLEYPEDLATRLQNQIQQVFDTKEVAKGETAYVSPTGVDGYYEYIFSPVIGEDGEVQTVAGSTRDITDRKKAEAAIRFQAHLLNTIEQSAIATGLDGKVTYWNRFAEKLYGWTAEEAIGKHIFELTTPDLMADEAAEIMAQLAGGHSWSGEFNVKRRDGTIFPAYVINSPVESDNGELIGIIGISVDITDRKRVEQELLRSRETLERRVVERTEELSALNLSLKAENVERRKIEEERVFILQRLVTAQEDVRRRIARDLHDQLGQHVTALRLKLESAAGMSTGRPAIEEQIMQAQEYARQVDADVDFLTSELRPTALDDLGLVAAIEIFVKVWSQNHSVAAEVYTKPFQHTVPSEAEIHVYRIVQEALNNTLKHANAKRVTLQLYSQKGELVVIIEDDGVGFDPENVSMNRPFGTQLGLIGMRERCLLLGGNLEIESALGKGTTIFARIPLSATSISENPVSQGRAK